MTDFATEAVEGEPESVSAPVESDEATFESACGRETFIDRVRAVRRYVRDDDAFQTNLSQRLAAPTAVHPVDACAALREVNPVLYSGLLELPGVDLVSASPGLPSHIEGDHLVTESIAGTHPWGATIEEDEAPEIDLTTDEKERVECAVLVDLECNDLGKVSGYGSAEVIKRHRMGRYSETMHLVSLVEGTRCGGTSLADAVAVVFLGGIITGVSKPRTMEVIDEFEATRRGPCTGSMLTVDFDNRAVLNTVIRILIRSRDEYHLHVGVGIVHDSDSRREYDETLAKARAFITVIDEALSERANVTVGTER